MYECGDADGTSRQGHSDASHWRQLTSKGKEKSKAAGKPPPVETQILGTQAVVPSEVRSDVPPQSERTWSELVRKRAKKSQVSKVDKKADKYHGPNRRKKPLSEAVVVTPAEDGTFAEVLKSGKQVIFLRT